MVRKLGKNSHETPPLIRAGLECRRLGRRLVIWHTTQLEFCRTMVRKHVQNSHETLSLRGGGLEGRNLGRRLGIWHITKLEILQDDGAKTLPEISRDSPFNKSGIRVEEAGKKAGDLAHHPA